GCETWQRSHRFLERAANSRGGRRRQAVLGQTARTDASSDWFGSRELHRSPSRRGVTVTRVGALFERTPEGVWVGMCPSIPGAVSQGRTLPQCRKKLRDAIASLLDYAPADDLEDLGESEAVVARA